MQKIYLVLLVGILGTFVGEQVQGMSAKINDVLLENVEALADMEMEEPITCWSSGDFTCPGNGKKVGQVYKGYSLDPDEETY